MKTVLIHGSKNDDRLSTFVARWLLANPGFKFEYPANDTDVNVGAAGRNYDVIISCELGNCDALAAGYKAQGVTVTTVGRIPPAPQVEKPVAAKNSKKTDI